MIERIARGIAEAPFHGWTLEQMFRVTASEDGDTFDQAAFEEVTSILARAALAVMAEPTEAMLRAAERADIASFGEASHRKIWQAMIAAAAGEGK